MSIITHQPETDLFLPRPVAEEAWDPHTVHTHYFGFDVAEEGIGAFIYIRHMPAFALCTGGVVIFQGLDNNDMFDCRYVDYELTMPWASTKGRTIHTENGLIVEFFGTRSKGTGFLRKS